MCFVIILLIFFSQLKVPIVYAGSNQTFFAQVMFEQCYLYKSPVDVDDASNIFFELPKSYFVQLTENVNSTFYKAQYLTFSGYVKKTSVQAVNEQPKTPFLTDIHFRVYADLSRDLRTAPNISSEDSKQIAYIPQLSRNLTYIGKIVGESLIEGRTNIWYYCKYSADKDYYGYVYSDFCDEMTTITQNTEQVNYIENPTFETKENLNSMPTNNSFVTVIICILCVPAIVFVVMISKGKNILSKQKSEDKEVIYY